MENEFEQTLSEVDMRRAKRLIMKGSTINPETGCWDWSSVTPRLGYGRVGWNGGSMLSHRLAIQAFGGSLVDGLEVDHLCRNRACCNPEHVEQVTHAENIRRGDGGKHIAARTCCPRGHPYERLRSRGSRECSRCSKAQKLASYYRCRARKSLNGASDAD